MHVFLKQKFIKKTLYLFFKEIIFVYNKNQLSDKMLATLLVQA